MSNDLRQPFDLKTHHLWAKVETGKDCYVSDMVRVRGRVSVISVGDHAQLHDFAVLYGEAPLKIGKGARLSYGVHVLAYAPIVICAGARIGGHAQLLAGYLGRDGWETGPIEVGTGACIGPGAILMPGSIIPAAFHVPPNGVFDAASCDQGARPSAL